MFKRKSYLCLRVHKKLLSNVEDKSTREYYGVCLKHDKCLQLTISIKVFTNHCISVNE